MRRSNKHDVHIVSSPVVKGSNDSGIDPDSLPPELVEIFKAAGIRKSDLRNKETAQFAMAFVAEHLRKQQSPRPQQPSLPPSSPPVAPLRRPDPQSSSSPPPSRPQPTPAPAPRPPLNRAKSLSPRPHSSHPATTLARELDASTPSSPLPPPRRDGPVSAPLSPPAPVPRRMASPGQWRGSVGPMPARHHQSLSGPVPTVGTRAPPPAAAAPPASAGAGVSPSALPPPPVLPEQVVEVISRRLTSKSVGSAPPEGPRCAHCQEPNAIFAETCVECGARLVLPVASRSPRAKVAPSVAAPLSRSSAAPALPSAAPSPPPRAVAAPPESVQTPAAPPPRASAMATVVTPAAPPAAPPPPPPPATDLEKSPRASPRVSPRPGDADGDTNNSNDFFSQLLAKGASLRSVDLEEVNKRLSLRDDNGALASALASALAKMRPAMVSQADDGDAESSDDW